MVSHRVIPLMERELFCLLTCLMLVQGLTCPTESGCSCDTQASCVLCSNEIATSLPRFSQGVKCLQLQDGHVDELLYLVDFTNMKRLELSGYYIPTLNRGALDLPTANILTHLTMSSNHIQTLSQDIFVGFHNLIHLDLSKNSIAKIPPTVFEKVVQLKFLWLQGNTLTSMPLELFTNQRELVHLDLSHNLITYVHPRQFMNLTSLQSLHLEYNRLKAVPEDVVDNFATILSLGLHNNPWDCSCSIAEFANLLQNSSESISNMQNISCRTPERYQGMKVIDMTSNQKNCSIPEITSISESQKLIYRSSVILHCSASGDPAPAILWITPMGELFGHMSQYHLLGQDHLQRVFEQHTYVGGEKLHYTYVSVDPDGLLTVEGMRGALTGNFTCIAVNPSGEDTAVVGLTVYSKIPDTYWGSLLLSAQVSGAFIIFGIIVGTVSFIVNKCRSRMEKKKKPEDIEEVSEASEEKSDTLEGACHGTDSYFDDETPPDGGSPFLSAGASPGKCHTPLGEEYDKFAPDFSERISETLDEVRWRLRHGVERKMEKVRSHVMTIRSSGSQYIDTIRSSSSQAANRVRAGVVMGMEQVKYGVQSIKEFCGTGDMGTQTISIISVSTDVDTQESTCVEVIRTTTFV